MFSIKAAVVAFIAALESVSGMPIATLDRVDNTQEFWARSAAILCDKTGETFCDTDMRFMTQNTEPSGFSQIIEYKSKTGATKRVCAILPPVDSIDPSYVAEAFTGGFTVEDDYPSNASTAAWLYLYHAAHCLDTPTGSATEENRAAAFATLGLTILQGDPRFTYPNETGQSRRIATMIKNSSAWWAAGTGERILFDQFKAETADVLKKKHGCNAQVLAATTIDTTKIPRANKLTAGQDCGQVGNGSARSPGVVSDANVWIWMYGTGGVGAPPVDYSPAKMFKSLNDAATYTLSTANKLAN